MRLALYSGFILALSLLLCACNSTRLSSEWREPTDDGRPVQKLAVLAIVKDASLSTLVENEAVRRLPNSVHASAARSMGITPDADINLWRGRLQREDFDAAVITRLVSVDEREIYHPPQTWITQDRPFYSPYYRDFWRYYPYATTVAVAPGYKTHETRYVVETILYRLPDGKPVWSAVTESVNPQSTLVLVNELVRLVQKQLDRAGLIRER